MQQTRSCFCYSPAHGAAIIGIAFFIGSTVVSLMLVGLVVEWNEVLQTIEHNNGNGSEEEEGDCEPHNFSSPFSISELNVFDVRCAPTPHHNRILVSSASSPSLEDPQQKVYESRLGLLS